MDDDTTLLRRYVEEGSEPAFAALVQRHLDLVYGAALRRTGGNPHRASDVTQQVFTQLAQHAEKLSHHPVLSAWLHTATRNAAIKLMLTEQRRRTRQAEALARTLTEEPVQDWDRIRPLLDDAIDALPEADRAAVVLRFLQCRAFAEIGATLRVSEDAARMRVDRALEKLRTTLSRRGIASTSAALAVALTDTGLLAAPAGLAASVTTGALTASAVTTGSVFATAGLLSMKTTHALLGIVALAATISAVYEYNQSQRLSDALTNADSERTALRAQLSSGQRTPTRSGAIQPSALAARETESPAATAANTTPAPKPAKGVKLNADPKASVDAHYRALYRQLNFTPEQSAQFRALMLQHLQRRGELLQAAKTQNPDLTPAQLSAIDAQADAEHLARMRATLGDPTVQAVQHYDETFPLRGPLEDLAKTLFYSDVPLTAAQADRLVESTSATLKNPQGKIDLDRYVQTDFYAALLDHSTGVLSPPQIAALQQMLEDDIEWRSTLPKKTGGTKAPGK